MVNDHVGRTDDYLNNLIKRKARSIARHPGFSVSDIEDIEHDLWKHLLKRQNRFDPKRSAFPTFADRVVNKKVIDIIRDRNAKRRDPRREAFSINEAFPDGEDHPTSLHETIASDRLPLPCHTDQANDIEVLRSKLQPDDVVILDGARAGNSKRQTADYLGISRRQVDNAFLRIQEVARELDLEDYLGH